MYGRFLWFPLTLALQPLIPEFMTESLALNDLEEGRLQDQPQVHDRGLPRPNLPCKGIGL